MKRLRMNHLLLAQRIDSGVDDECRVRVERSVPLTLINPVDLVLSRSSLCVCQDTKLLKLTIQ